MSVTVISPGGNIDQDPSDVRVYLFDWDTLNLPTGVHIDTSTFVVTTMRPVGATPLVIDHESIIGGAGVGRSTTLRVAGGQAGAVYNIANKIVTDESPTQTKERSFFLLVKDL